MGNLHEGGDRLRRLLERCLMLNLHITSPIAVPLLVGQVHTLPWNAGFGNAPHEPTVKGTEGGDTTPLSRFLVSGITFPNISGFSED